MSISAMKQALEALEDYWKVGPQGTDDAITALRQAIAEAEQPDLARVGEVGMWGHKREWVGLTDEEVQEAGRYSYVRGGTSERLYHIMWNSQPSASIGWCREELIAFAQTIEARIKDKNT
jgi:hypothetical protein